MFELSLLRTIILFLTISPRVCWIMDSFVGMDAHDADLFIFPSIWPIVSWILHFIFEMDAHDADLFIFFVNFTDCYLNLAFLCLNCCYWGRSRCCVIFFPTIEPDLFIFFRIFYTKNFTELTIYTLKLRLFRLMIFLFLLYFL